MPFQIDAKSLNTTESLNFEEQNDYSVEVVAEDRNTNEITTETYSISVLDINDAPLITGQQPLSATAEEPLSLQVEDFDITDEDASDSAPEDFLLSVREGDNYLLAGNEIEKP